MMRDDADTLLSKTTVTFMEQLRRLKRVYVKQKPTSPLISTPIESRPSCDSVLGGASSLEEVTCSDHNVDDEEVATEEEVEPQGVGEEGDKEAALITESKRVTSDSVVERCQEEESTSKVPQKFNLKSIGVKGGDVNVPFGIKRPTNFEDRKFPFESYVACKEDLSPSKIARDKFLQDLVTPSGDVMPGLVKDVPRRHDVKPPRKPSFKTYRVEALASKYNLLDTGLTPRVVVSRRNSNSRRPAVTVRRVSHVTAAIERFEQAVDKEAVEKDKKALADVKKVPVKEAKNLLIADGNHSKTPWKINTNNKIKDVNVGLISKDAKTVVNSGIRDTKPIAKSDSTKLPPKTEVRPKPGVKSEIRLPLKHLVKKDFSKITEKTEGKPKPGLKSEILRPPLKPLVKKDLPKVTEKTEGRPKPGLKSEIRPALKPLIKKDLPKVTEKDSGTHRAVPVSVLGHAFKGRGTNHAALLRVEEEKTPLIPTSKVPEKSPLLLPPKVQPNPEVNKSALFKDDVQCQANKSQLFTKVENSKAVVDCVDDSDYEIIETGKQEPMKANTSFLWGLVQNSVAVKDTVPASKANTVPSVKDKGKLPAIPCDKGRGTHQCESVVRGSDKDKLIVPEKDEVDDIELTSDQEEYGTYDDIHPPSMQHYSSLENIYDDVGNLATESLTNDKEGSDDGSLRDYEYVGSDRDSNIYACVSQMQAETVSNCYESISLYASDAVSRNNSLYGGIQPITGVASDRVYEVNYQLTMSGQPRSDTSDEWIDLEISDSEIRRPNLVVPDKPTRAMGRSPSWSQRVRRQWSSRSPRKPKPDSSGSDSESHHYEVLYEVTEKQDPEVPFDDFDSSDDEIATQPPFHGRLPEPPPVQNIYAISKMAEVASNKLLQLRKSLSRIRVKRHTTEIRLTDAPLSLPALPSEPPIESKPPDTKQQPATATVTDSRLEHGNRKYWSLRKFRRSRSAQMSSTFYLTEALDLDAKEIPDPVNERLKDATNNEATTTNNETRPTRVRSSSIRPSSPPPLPPGPKRPERKDKRSNSTTSWYAECGLFDAKRNSRPLTSSWYADVGLWEDNSSIPDSIQSSPPESSASSSGSEPRFIDEPLYQFYAASVVERDLGDTSDSDGVTTSDSDCFGPGNVRPTAMDLVPRHGQHRTLWCEIPEVLHSGVLASLNSKQKKLQEARFEILASQASYVKSLGVLADHFVASPLLADTTVLSKSDARILFGNVASVRQCARRLLSRLEQCWQRSFLLADICDVIFDHASKHYNAYVKYCCNQIYLDRTLRRLKLEQGRFFDALATLECNSVCESLSLHSFLMLPMQRITRLPLLLDAVLTRVEAEDSEEYHSCARALSRLNQVVKECNEGARRMERMEEMLILSQRLEFNRGVKPVAVISSARWLVRSGEMSQLTWRGEEKMTFGRKFNKTQVHVFLFTDLLLVAKKKSDDCYTVMDYCPRNLVQMTSVDALTNLPVKMVSEAGRNPMLLTLLCNHDNKTVEMVVSCALESDRQRWLSAVQQPTSDNPEESVYEQWDCPQVTARHSFIASQPDELALDVADVVNVFRKLADGWYYGERIRDGESGWFPANHTQEIASAHVRARNLKQRYRLLALSGNFLESQRKIK